VPADLGSAIVGHLAELHGGTVRAERPGHGRGATFTLSLPLPREGVDNAEAAVMAQLTASRADAD
jgi:signal transduction histidine kinase